MFVRANDYQLVRAELEVNRLSGELRSSGMTSVSATMYFNEILPGIAVLDLSEAITKFRNGALPGVEIGRVLDIKWVNGPP